jgi:hypothetical protein
LDVPLTLFISILYHSAQGDEDSEDDDDDDELEDDEPDVEPVRPIHPVQRGGKNILRMQQPEESSEGDDDDEEAEANLCPECYLKTTRRKRKSPRNR